MRARIGADAPPERRGSAPPARLLSGLARCSSCDSKLYVRRNGNGVAAYSCSSRSNGAECRRSVSVTADLLDEYVVRVFLDTHGATEVVERVEEAHEPAAVADVERAIRDTVAAMVVDDADVAALAIRLTTLKGRRRELAAQPASRVVRLVPTGRSYAEVWEDASLEERRALIAENVSLLIVRPGQRGRRGLDPERVVMAATPPFAADLVDAAEYVPGRATTVVAPEGPEDFAPA